MMCGLGKKAKRNDGKPNGMFYAKMRKGLREMESLDLNDGKNGDEVAKYLAKVFEDSEITELDLTENTIRDDLMKYFLEVLKFSQITSLRFSENSIGDEGVKYLAEALADTQITNLDLSDNFIYDGIKYLAENLKYSKVSNLNLNSVSMGDEGIKYLAQGLKESEVKTLYLRNTEISDDGVKSLAQVLEYTKITYLYLTENHLGIDGALSIHEILDKTKIQRLAISIYFTGNDHLMYTLNNDEIGMTLSSYNIGTNGARFINKISQNIGIYNLAIVSDILNLNEAQYLAEAFDNIKIRICILQMKIDDMKPSIQAFKNSRIAGLVPRFQKSKSTDGKNLAAFLEEVNVISLMIDCHDLRDDFIKHLAPVLKNSTIMNLQLSETSICNKRVKYLAEVLRDTRITTLDLSKNKITDKGAKYLADGLIHSQLRYIDLSRNKIKNMGYQYLKDIINDTFVTEVKCDHNNLDGFLSSNQQYSILKNTNVTLADKITSLFESMVTLNPSSNQLEFHKNDCSFPENIDQFIFLTKTLNDNPILKVHIFHKICRKERNLDMVMMDKIDELIKSFPDKFNSLFNDELLSLMEVAPDFDYVNLVRQLDDSKLYDIVQNLLSHRELFYVDENREILHPYIYKTLHKHNMILFNEELEPGKREKIICYYRNHSEFDGAQEIIDLLQKMSSENKI